MGDISKNFSYKEFEKSDTAISLGIDNKIKEGLIKDNIKELVLNILQPLRDAWGQPLFINSGYRCLKVNEAVGGVPTSQHVLGQASDVGCSNPYEVAKLVKRMNLDFDQMGIYPSFVHLSYRSDGTNRRQVFYSSKWNGRRDL